MANEKKYDPGTELLPDWSGVPIDDSPEPEADPHEGTEEDE
jgi:hypothetical protein